MIFLIKGMTKDSSIARVFANPIIIRIATVKPSWFASSSKILITS